MGIKCTTPLKDVRKYIDQAIEKVDNIVVRNLQRLGEEAVIRARSRSGEESWYDQTGNLRSSVGYVIARDGMIVSSSDFAKVRNGNEGSSEGKKYALELASSNPGRYVLVVVAGMNYASYVEDMENKDVLASTKIFAEQELPNVLQRLQKQLNR